KEVYGRRKFADCPRFLFTGAEGILKDERILGLGLTIQREFDHPYQMLITFVEIVHYELLCNWRNFLERPLKCSGRGFAPVTLWTASGSVDPHFLSPLCDD